MKTVYNESQRKLMLEVAVDSIRHGLEFARAIDLDLDKYEPELIKPGACFVTLHKNKQLRGCIGHLEAIQPLIADIAQNAYAAAFSDPRFQALKQEEFSALEIDISVLSPAQPLEFKDEADLLAQIRPGVDGLILEDNFQKGTFLPSVWQQLPDPKSFIRQLKIKAGLQPDYWSDNIKVSRYQTESFKSV